MKLKIAFTATALALAVPAFAADLGPAYMEPEAPFMPFSWVGFYAGAQVGYGWGDFDGKVTSTIIAGSVPFNADADGFIGGLHLGYNWQVDQIVFGIEGDIEASGISGSDPSFGVGAQTAIDVNWQGSLRARLGYSIDNFLPYITVGVAFADVDVVTIAAIGQQGWSDTTTGWTLGAGVEYAFAPDWTARIEYRYTDYGNISSNLGPVFPNNDQRGDLDSHAVRLGISYRF